VELVESITPVFIASSIIGGIYYDAVKKACIVTLDYVKGKLKKFLCNEDCESIVEVINQAPENCKQSSESLAKYLEENKTVNQIIARTVNYNNISNHEHDNTYNGPVIKGNTMNNPHFDFRTQITPQAEPPKKY
jgi:hypothetical protein